MGRVVLNDLGHSFNEARAVGPGVVRLPADHRVRPVVGFNEARAVGPGVVRSPRRSRQLISNASMRPGLLAREWSGGGGWAEPAEASGFNEARAVGPGVVRGGEITLF